jgi:filamentous hemagglutinin family protein
MAKRSSSLSPETLLFSLLLSLVAFCFPASAEVTLDGSLGGPAGAINPVSNTYDITESLGTRPGGGPNLFHSFSAFNIATGEAARFSGSPDIANIIARVTGGASSIDGLIISTIDGANLFLLNPAGVLFGPNASLDLRGSFHVSTANTLVFADGAVFPTGTGTQPILSVTNPVAFGFLGSNPAAITGDRSYLEVPQGQTLSIVGGDLAFTAYPVAPTDLLIAYPSLSAPGGTVNLASVASPGELRLSDMDVSGFSELGRISLAEGAKASATSWYGYYPAGTVVFRGGEIMLSSAGVDAYGSPGGLIDISGNSLHLDNSYLVAANANFYGVDSTADHQGVGISIDLSDRLVMTHASAIDTQNLQTGKGGSIEISAPTILLGDALIDDYSYNETNYYGYISNTVFGYGASGDISLTAADIVVRNGFYVTTQTYAFGDAGNVNVQASNSLTILNQGNIGTGAYGFGNGGIVTVSAPDVYVSAAQRQAVENISTITGLASQAGYASNGGALYLTADRVQLLDGGQISSVLYDIWGYALGQGADVHVSARELIVSGFVEDPRYAPVGYSLSGIDSRVMGAGATGTGGNITLDVEMLNISSGGAIRTGLYEDAQGTAGNIAITAGQIDIASRGQIYADSFRGTGDSGDIDISAGTMRITGAQGTPRPGLLDFDFTGISTSTNSGRGGAIDVNLSRDLAMAREGGIRAGTEGTGTGGTVRLSAANILLESGSTISAASTGTGNAGDIELTAGRTMTLRNSSIATEASVDADGGNIVISVPYRILLDGSRITSSVGGGPETTGGNITIDPEYFVMRNSSIIANAYEGTGGNIRIVAGVFLADPSSVIDASSELGVSGTVDIQAPIQNISGLLKPLSSEFASADALLRERCMARLRAGKYSSFVVGGRDGLPVEPGNPLPGPVF